MKDAYWIGERAETKLAIVLRPRGGDWLETDLQRLKREGVDVLVSMLTPEEELELGLSREKELAARSGLRLFFPACGSFRSYRLRRIPSLHSSTDRRSGCGQKRCRSLSRLHRESYHRDCVCSDRPELDAGSRLGRNRGCPRMHRARHGRSTELDQAVQQLLVILVIESCQAPCRASFRSNPN